MMVVLLIFSFIGYMLLARRGFKLHWEFIPLFVFSSISCVIFLCGLLGALRIGSIAVFAIGLILFISVLAKLRQKGKSKRSSTPLIKIAALMVVLIIFTLLPYFSPARLSGLAAKIKQLLNSGRIPPTAYTLIDSNGSPLGVPNYISIAIASIALLIIVLFLVKQIRNGSYKRLSNSLFQVVFLAGSVLFLALLLQCELVHYDNFSHWAVVLKQMLSSNSFPSADSALIDFKNYPLGISSFIYYVCLFCGRSQQIMLVAQGLLIFSCFYAMFGVIFEKKRFLLYAFMGLGCACLSFFNITIRINNLLVDFLLPILTLAMFAAAYWYRKDSWRACLVVMPISGLLTVTKSTGIIFAAFGLLFLLYILIANKKKAPLLKFLCPFLFTLLGTALPYCGWSWHMKTVFSGVQNKFDLQSLPTKKTPEQMREIALLFLKACTDLSTRPAIGILVFNIIAVAAAIFAAMVLKKKWKLWKTLIALNVVLLLYYLGILALYLFSMPLDEALWLAGFERYASSIVVLFVGGLVICATVDIESSFYYRVGQVSGERSFRSITSKNYYQKGVLGCMAIAVILLLSEYNGIQWNINLYETSVPNQVKTLTGDKWYQGGAEDTRRYLLYAPDKDSQVTNFYMQYVGRYLLFAPNVDGICLFYEDNMDNLLSGYDYLVMVESDSNAKQLLNKHYGVSGDEGIYRVRSTNGKIALAID